VAKEWPRWPEEGQKIGRSMTENHGKKRPQRGVIPCTLRFFVHLSSKALYKKKAFISRSVQVDDESDHEHLEHTRRHYYHTLFALDEY